MPTSGDTEIDPSGGAITSGLDISTGIRALMHGREIGSSISSDRDSMVSEDAPTPIRIAGTGINSSIETRGPIGIGAATTGAITMAITGATTGDGARRRIGAAAMRSDAYVRRALDLPRLRFVQPLGRDLAGPNLEYCGAGVSQSNSARDTR